MKAIKTNLYIILLVMHSQWKNFLIICYNISSIFKKNICLPVIKVIYCHDKPKMQCVIIPMKIVSNFYDNVIQVMDMVKSSIVIENC